MGEGKGKSQGRHIAIKRENKADKTNLSDGQQKLEFKATLKPELVVCKVCLTFSGC